MDVKPAEFFIMDVGTDEVHKINGVVFKRRSRLLAACIRFYSDSFVWFTHDVNTGLCVAASDYYPASDNTIARLDEEIKRFNKAIPKEERKHYAAMIKKAYDEAPEIKKQVFGGERNVKT